MRVWGDEAYVEGYDANKSIFKLPLSLASKEVVDVVAGSTFIAAITSDGHVIVWGAGANPGQLSALSVPDVIQGHVKKLAIYRFNILALTDSGAVAGWGNDFRSVISGIPLSLSNVVDIGIGVGCGFAWQADGTVVNWGEQQLAPPEGIKVLSASGYESLSLYVDKLNNGVEAWGQTTSFPSQIPPTGLVASEIVTSINLGLFGALKLDQTIEIWGDDNYGMLPIPSEIAQVAQLSLGFQHALICRTDGTLASWGDGITMSNGLGVPTGWQHASRISAGLGFSVGLFSEAPNGLAPNLVEWVAAPVINSNAAPGIFIGSLKAKDADPGDYHTFELVSGIGDEGNEFVSIINNGVYVFGRIPGSISSFNIRVKAIDSGNLEVVAPLTISVVSNSEPELQDDEHSGACGTGIGAGVLFLTMFLALYPRRGCVRNV